MHRTRIRTTFAILSIMMLCACSSVPVNTANNMPVLADGKRMDIALGDSVQLSDASTLRYVRVVSDGRCRPEVKCIWAGQAHVEFRWTPATGAPAQTFVLTSPDPQPHSQDIGTRRLTLTWLEMSDTPDAGVLVETR